MEREWEFKEGGREGSGERDNCPETTTSRILQESR